MRRESITKGYRIHRQRSQTVQPGKEEDSFADPNWWAEMILASDFVFDPDDGRFDNGVSMLRNWRDEFYRWDNGCYVKVSDAEMRRLAVQTMQYFKGQEPKDNSRKIRITTHFVTNILLCLAGIKRVHIPESRELDSWDDGIGRGPVMAFNNVLVYFTMLDEDGRARSDVLTPRYFSLAKLPYDYDPDAECPRWRAFLEDVMQGDAERIELLQQWAGYLLTQSLRQQKFLLIAGDGQNGKTVFTTILEKMVGESNVSHVPLSQFSANFALVTTLGKVLNSTSESSHRLDGLAETALKSYTSGDWMTFQRKYKEPIHARPTAKIMVSTNQLPQFADKSIGIWRRMLFVPFENSYPEQMQNRNLIDELSRELPGIFNWAFAGLKSLEQTGQFVSPARCQAAIERYRRDVNPARSFLKDNYIAGADFEGLPCREVYQSYVAWCEVNGYKPMNNTNFGKEVKRALPGVKRELRGDRVQRIWHYSGLTVRKGSEVISASRSLNSFYGS